MLILVPEVSMLDYAYSVFPRKSLGDGLRGNLKREAVEHFTSYFGFINPFFAILHPSLIFIFPNR
jgi:hypothetical protein